MLPALASASDMMLFSVVVLPAPFRPSRHTDSPWFTSSDTSNRMWLVA
jgi:hypothetical protein